jgi:FMN phosphatase YigB (HAD superfamily)
LYRLDSGLLQATIDAYQRISGQQVDFEDVRTWAITAELASYCHHLALGETAHPSFVRTRNNLRNWLPEFAEHDGALPIKAVIFDCFGVLASEGLRPFRQKYFGHDASLLQKAVQLGRQVDAGQKSYDTLVTEMAKMAGITPEEVRQHIECNEPDEALFQCIETELKPRYKIGMLSNAGDNFLGEIFTPKQVALFEEIALSYQTGYVKPAKQAYLDIARSLDVAPSECLFIDDQPRYLTGARAVGMQTIQYKNFDQFRRELDTVIQHKSRTEG